jgi:hypothetical protein
VIVDHVALLHAACVVDGGEGFGQAETFFHTGGRLACETKVSEPLAISPPKSCPTDHRGQPGLLPRHHEHARILVRQFPFETLSQPLSRVPT